MEPVNGWWERKADTLRQQLEVSVKLTDPPPGDIRWLIERRHSWAPGEGRVTLVERGYLTAQEYYALPTHERNHVGLMLMQKDIGHSWSADKAAWIFAREF